MRIKDQPDPGHAEPAALALTPTICTTGQPNVSGDLCMQLRDSGLDR